MSSTLKPNWFSNVTVPRILVNNALPKNIYPRYEEPIKLEICLPAKHQGFEVFKHFLYSRGLYSLLERVTCQWDPVV